MCYYRLMESYELGKYGLFLETGSHLSPVFLGVVFGDVLVTESLRRTPPDPCWACIDVPYAQTPCVPHQPSESMSSTKAKTNIFP